MITPHTYDLGPVASEAVRAVRDPVSAVDVMVTSDPNASVLRTKTRALGCRRRSSRGGRAVRINDANVGVRCVVGELVVEVVVLHRTHGRQRGRTTSLAAASSSGRRRRPERPWIEEGRLEGDGAGSGPAEQERRAPNRSDRATAVPMIETLMMWCLLQFADRRPPLLPEWVQDATVAGCAARER